jgi:deoxyhypusine synthase
LRGDMKSDPRNKRPPKKVSIVNRKSKVTVKDLAGLPDDFSWYGKLSEMIPRILKGNDIAELSERVVRARNQGRPVVWMMGGHVVKCGFGGIIGDLIRRDLVTGVAMNGACAIHDVEIAMWGKTSEDVEDGLRRGEFGMAEETSEFFNRAASSCLREDIGLGEALGRNLTGLNAPNPNVSIIASAHSLNIPITVHVAVGTDIVHQHKDADGKAIGHGTMKDFRRFASIIADLNG